MNEGISVICALPEREARFRRAISGSSGPLYAVGLLRAAEHVASAAGTGPSAWAEAFERAVAAISYQIWAERRAETAQCSMRCTLQWMLCRRPAKGCPACRGLAAVRAGGRGGSRGDAAEGRPGRLPWRSGGGHPGRRRRRCKHLASCSDGGDKVGPIGLRNPLRCCVTLASA